MPWQANIWVGEQPTSIAHLRDIFKNLGIDDSKVDWQKPNINMTGKLKNLPTLSITTNIGTIDRIIINAYFEYEAIDNSSLASVFSTYQHEDFWCIVGACLTGRYNPAYIDIDSCGDRIRGTPQPFPLDLDLLNTILNKVKTELNWPKAQIYMFENFC